MNVYIGLLIQLKILAPIIQNYLKKLSRLLFPTSDIKDVRLAKEESINPLFPKSKLHVDPKSLTRKLKNVLFISTSTSFNKLFIVRLAKVGILFNALV